MEESEAVSETTDGWGTVTMDPGPLLIPFPFGELAKYSSSTGYRHTPSFHHRPSLGDISIPRPAPRNTLLQNTLRTAHGF